MSASRIPEELRERVRTAAANRCGYCLSPQHLVYGLLEAEHIVPEAAGGSDDEKNLWLACRLCNGFKGARQNALDPETGHFSILAVRCGRSILSGAVTAF